MRNWRTWFEPMCQSDVNIIIHSFLSFVICMYPLEVYTIASCICIYIYNCIYIYILLYTSLIRARMCTHYRDVGSIVAGPPGVDLSPFTFPAAVRMQRIRLLRSPLRCMKAEGGLRGMCKRCPLNLILLRFRSIYIYTTSEYIWIQFYWKRTCPIW